MNMDLIIIVIIFYILKNNSYKYCYAENRNQKLLLFLLLINEMDQCLNNKYIYMNLTNNKNSYWMNYPNNGSNNSNNIINTNKINTKNNNEENSIKSEKDITINNNKYDVLKENTDNPISKDNDNFIDTNEKNIINNDNEDVLINNDNEISINSNEHNIIDSNKDTNISVNNVINDDKNCPTDKNKDNIVNKNKLISDIFNLNNSDKDIPDNINTDITTKNNKDKSMINNNYTSNNLKGKSIKPATKAHNEPSAYTASCQNTNSIPSNSISNTFKQLPLGKTITALNEFTKRFNLTAPTPLTDAKVKVPVLVGSTNIIELFHGRVTFSKPIISILKVTNEIFITSKSILPNIHTNANNAELHYEGFLKTQLEYLEDIIIEKYQIKCDSKHYIMLIPFSGTKNLNLTDEIINSPDVILKDLTLDINKSTFFVNTCLEEPTKGNNYVNLYKTCNLTVKAECDISLYRKKLVDL